MITRSVFFLLALSGVASAQMFSIGIKAGVPLTDGFQATSVSGSTYTPLVNSFVPTSSSEDAYLRRYTVGPTVEIHLPLHLSFEVDALYRRGGYNYAATGDFLEHATPVTVALATITQHATANDWQIPFLAKWEPGSGHFRPFVDAGPTYRHISGVSGVASATGESTFTNSEATNSHGNAAGVSVGAGVDVKLFWLRISPEIRYTRWFSQPSIGSFATAITDADQADFLLGLSF